MSALAGALDPIIEPISYQNILPKDDKDSGGPSVKSVNQLQSTKHDDEDQDEEMQDLFGEDQDVEFAKRDE